MFTLPISVVPAQKSYWIELLFTIITVTSARFLGWSEAVPLRYQKWSVIYGIGFVQCEFLFRPWRLKKVGGLSYYGDDGSEKKNKKMNLRPFKHYRVYLELFNSSNVGGFSTFLRIEFLRVLSMFK